jgi:hypothetical protein
MYSLLCVRLQSALLRLGIFEAINVIYINISCKRYMMCSEMVYIPYCTIVRIPASLSSGQSF